MVAEDRASGKDDTSFWRYGRGFGIQTTTNRQIEHDFSVSWPNPATPAPDQRHHPRSTEPLDIRRACRGGLQARRSFDELRTTLSWRGPYEALNDFSRGRSSSVRVMALKSLMPCVAAVTSLDTLKCGSVIRSGDDTRRRRVTMGAVVTAGFSPCHARS